MIDKQASDEKIRNFKYLEGLIHEGKNEIVLNSDICLDEDEISEYKSGIKIDINDLIIDGNNHTIDAMHKARIFEINSKNVIFKNVTFKRATNKDTYGGAIKITEKGSCNFKNCNFIRNSILGFLTPGDGHKFYNRLIFHLSPLLGLGDVIAFGGAVSNYGSASFENCRFIKNKSDYIGGAIYNNGICRIVSSDFVNNFSRNGGAISNSDTLYVSDSVFEDNSAKKTFLNGNGGAISNSQSECTLNNCKFINNSCANKGGAIYNIGKVQEKIMDAESESHITCDKCEFSNNVSKGYGGVIWTNSHSKLYNCEFNNNISKDGNIIYDDGIADTKLIIESSTIINNVSKNKDLCLNRSTLSLNKLKINNEIGNYVIHNSGGTLILSDLKFKYSNRKSIFNNSLLHSSDENIKDITETGKNSVMKFKNEISNSNNGFEYLNDLINSNSDYIKLDCDITMNEIEQDFYEGGIELNQDNITIDGQNHIIDAKRLSRIFIVTGKGITLKNIVFQNGFYFKNEFDKLDKGGGVIYCLNHTSLDIENCVFKDNVSRNIAGCINNKGTLNISETIFNNNTAQKICGTIANFNKLNLKDCKFEDNFAPNNYYEDFDQYNSTGGNIFNKSSFNHVNCVFKKTKLYYISTSENFLTVYIPIIIRALAIIVVPALMVILYLLSWIFEFIKIDFLSIILITTLIWIAFELLIVALSKIITYYFKKRGFDYYKITQYN